MNEVHSCEQSCTQACADETPCAFHFQRATASLTESLARFEREAVRGVIDTGRYRCRYFTWGEGPPIVFLHGIEGTSQSFIPVAALLSKFFRCVAYDLPAGGEDGADLQRCTLTALVADLWSLVDHLGLKQSYLFGSSLGATIALEALHAQPARVPRAILQAASAWKPLRWRERLTAWLMRRWLGPISSFPLWARRICQRHLTGFRGRREQWEHFLADAGSVAARTMGHRLRLLGAIDLRQILSAISQPVLLVNGDRDVDGKADSDLLRDRLPSAGRAIIKGSGRFPTLSHSELAAQVVHAFLTPSCQKTPQPGEKEPACDHFS